MAQFYRFPGSNPAFCHLFLVPGRKTDAGPEIKGKMKVIPIAMPCKKGHLLVA